MNDILDQISSTEQASHSLRRWDYIKRRIAITQSLYPKFGCLSFSDLVSKLYLSDHSCNEISAIIKEKSGHEITPRSILRELRLSKTPIKTQKQSFNLAMSKGRVQWAYVEHKKKTPGSYVSKKLRFQILSRDGFRCVLCGSDQTKTVLEIDHILPKMSGGTNELFNLRTLCHECNLELCSPKRYNA